MKTVKLILVAILLSAWTKHTFANTIQHNDTTKTQTIDSVTARISYYNNLISKPNNFNANYDTSLVNFQKYNQISRNNPNYFSLGNIGLPGLNLFEHQTPNKHDNSLFKIQYTGFQENDVLFFNSKQAFTELSYINGSKKENLMHVIHTQNINPFFNVAIKYRVLHSEGFLKNQLANHRNLWLTASYTTKNQRISGIYYLIYNKLRNEENGGIPQYEILNNPKISDSRLLDVNLYDAHNFFTNQKLKVHHQMALSKPHLMDSSKADIKRNNNQIYLKHTLEANQNNYRFTDLLYDENFYPIAINENISTDTFSTKTVGNILQLTLHNYKQDTIRKSVSSIGFSHAYNDIKNLGNDTVFNNLGVFFHTDYRFFTNIKANLNAYYSFYGYENNNYNIHASVFSQEENNNKRSYGLIAGVKSAVPEYFIQSYTSRFYSWNNTFKPQQSQYLKAIFNTHNIRITAGYTHLINPIVIEKQSVPVQYATESGYFQSMLQGKHSVGRWHFTGTAAYQKALDETLIPLPNILINQSTEFRSKPGSSIIEYSVGYEVTWFSEWYAYSYNPMLSSFYLQNNQKTGNYPFVDIFLSLKIKRLRALIKYEHINMGFSGDYFVYPSYPAQGRSLKVGVSWIMLN